MRLFAQDAVRARSRFWYFLSQLRRAKRAKGEVLAVHEIFEKGSRIVKNYGIWVRYDSRSGTHNMYKEYRDTTLVGAVEQLYSEMASRHRARTSTIQIVRTAVVKAAETRRVNTQQFLNSKISFPLPPNVLPRPPQKSEKKTFSKTRPVLVR